MYKKTVEYEDFDGNTVREELLFRLNKPELLDINESMGEGGLEGFINSMDSDNRDVGAIKNFFEMMILTSYGVRDSSGKRFIKSHEERELFRHSLAYETIFDEILLDADAAADFFNAIIPKDLLAQAEQISNGKQRVVKPPVRR
jgi:hypothetical protein